MMTKDSKIYVAGHRGLVGNAIVRQLESKGHKNLVLRSRQELDLMDQVAVSDFFSAERPDYVFLAAAKVGGIYANDTYPAEFIQSNLLVSANVIDSSYRFGVKKLLNLGSSCIYPRDAPQPMKEEYLLSGSLEPTNEWYAIAKIAAIKMCQAYRKQYGFNAISAMPTNLYGPGDNFDLEKSHVLPALLRKFHEAKINNDPHAVVWGTGRPRREFLHVDDLADALIYLMEHYDSMDIVNVGVGEDVSIEELANILKDVTGYKGDIVFDSSRPDGMLRKLLDVTHLREQGWTACVGLHEGISSTYEWFLRNENNIRM